MTTIPVELLERIAKPVFLKSQEDAHADACAELRALLSEQPQAGAEAFCDGHCSALSPHPDCKLCAEGRHDQANEVRRLREALERLTNGVALETSIDWNCNSYHPALIEAQGMALAALTQSPKGEEE